MNEKFKFSFSGLYDENLDHIEIDGVKFYPEKKLTQLERVAEAAKAYNFCVCQPRAYRDEDDYFSTRDKLLLELQAALADLEPK